MRLLSGKGSQAVKSGVAAVFAECGGAAFRTLRFGNGSELPRWGGFAPGSGSHIFLRTRIQAGRNALLSAATASRGWRRQRDRAVNALPRRILGCLAEALFELEMDRLNGAPAQLQRPPPRPGQRLAVAWEASSAKICRQAFAGNWLRRLHAL